MLLYRILLAVVTHWSCYNLMGPPSYTRSVVDRNVVMRRIPVYLYRVPTLNIGCWQQLWNRSNSSAVDHDRVTGRVVPDVSNITVFVFHFHRLYYCLQFNPDRLTACLRIQPRDWSVRCLPVTGPPTPPSSLLRSQWPTAAISAVPCSPKLTGTQFGSYHTIN
jgi:hypothetical protein